MKLLILTIIVYLLFIPLELFSQSNIKNHGNSGLYNSTSFDNRLKSAQDCWSEKVPGTCKAGGPPPICPVDHWEQGNCEKAWLQFSQYQSEYMDHLLNEARNQTLNQILNFQPSMMLNNTLNSPVFQPQTNYSNLADKNKKTSNALNQIINQSNNHLQINDEKAGFDKSRFGLILQTLPEIQNKGLEKFIDYIDGNGTYQNSILGKYISKSSSKAMGLLGVGLQLSDPKNRKDVVLARTAIEMTIGAIPVVGLPTVLISNSISIVSPQYNQAIDNFIGKSIDNTIKYQEKMLELEMNNGYYFDPYFP